jgi:hypothetical protein
MGFFVWFENSECIERPGAASALERTSASGGGAEVQICQMREMRKHAMEDFYCRDDLIERKHLNREQNVVIFWDIAPYSSYVNRRFGGTHHLHLQVQKSAEQETSVYRVPSPYVTRRFGGTYHLHLQVKKLAEQETSA